MASNDQVAQVCFEHADGFYNDVEDPGGMSQWALSRSSSCINV